MVVAVAGLFVALAAAPVTVPRVELTWRAPPACPGDDVVRERLHALAPTLPPGPPVRVTAQIQPRPGPGWRLQLALHGPELDDRRIIEARDCRDLADVTALLIALAVAPEAVVARALAPASPAPVALPPTGGGRPASSVSEATSAAGGTTAPRDSAPPGSPGLAPRLPPAAPGRAPGPFPASPLPASASPAASARASAPPGTASPGQPGAFAPPSPASSGQPGTFAPPSPASSDQPGTFAPPATASPGQPGAFAPLVTASPDQPGAFAPPATASPRSSAAPRTSPGAPALADPAAPLADPVLAPATDLAPAASPPRAPLRGAVRLGGGGEVGGIPAWSSTAGLLVALLGRAWRLEVAGTYASRALAYADRAQVGGWILLAGGALRGCGVPRWRRLEFPICGGLELGLLRAVARGVADPQPAADLWLALQLSPGLAWVPRRWLALTVAVDILVALRRPGFHVATLPELARAEPVGLRPMLGLEFRFP